MSPAPITDLELNAYIDGEIPPERRAAVDTWLAASPADAARVEIWRRQNDIIRSAFARVSAEPLPSPSLSHERTGTGTRTAAGDEPIRAPIRQVRRLDRIRRRQRSRTAVLTAGSFLGGAALAVSAALIVGSAPSYLAGPRTIVARPVDVTVIPDPMNAAAAAAMEAYRIFARDPDRPVEIPAAETPRLLRWLSDRVGLPVKAPDLVAEGLTLLGGRITPGVAGPAAYLVYEDGKGARFGVFVARAPGGDTPARLVKSQDVAAVVWTSEGAVRALTGPAEPDRLSRIAARLGASWAAKSSP